MRAAAVPWLLQVLMISAHPEAWEFQPENTIKLKPWTAPPTDTPDTTLLDLIPMLQARTV